MVAKPAAAGRRWPRALGLLLAAAVLVSAAGGFAGGVLYGSTDDRAFPYVMVPAALAAGAGWVILLLAAAFSRSAKALRIWLIAAAVALPFLDLAAAVIVLNLATALHQYPACPPGHLGPC